MIETGEGLVPERRPGVPFTWCHVHFHGKMGAGSESGHSFLQLELEEWDFYQFSFGWNDKNSPNVLLLLSGITQ